MIVALILFPFLCFAETITFDQALELLQNRNSKLLISKEETQLAQLGKLTARAGLLPTINFEHSERKSLSSQMKGRQDSINAQLNLFHFGKTWADIETNNYKLSQQIIEEQLSKLDVEREASSLLLDNILRKKQLEISNQMLLSKMELQKVVKALYQRGLVAQVEVDKMQVDYNNTLAETETAEATYEKSNVALLGTLGNSELESVWPWSRNFANNQLEEWGSANPDFDNHPALLKSHSALMVQQGRLREIISNALPRLDLNFSWSRSQYDYQRDWSRDRTAMLSFNVPLFSNLNDYYAYAEQKVAVLNASLQNVELRRDFLPEYQEIQRHFLRTHKSHNARRENWLLAQKIFSLANNKFRDGRLSVNELISEEERLYISEARLLESEWTLHLAFLNLCHKRGKQLQACLQEISRK